MGGDPLTEGSTLLAWRAWTMHRERELCSARPQDPCSDDGPIWHPTWRVSQNTHKPKKREVQPKMCHVMVGTLCSPCWVFSREPTVPPGFA